ncbi:bifunctional metallophosphatase/5'-nucleotidase [Muribaculaceae bacterium Isolate-104 (HZI)]|nr:bifunctional metallophosphatase/5'-nucleotidase [Muribaculaceae bacterium Isolate-104 (HZI)]
MKFYRNFCLTLIAGFSTISSMNVMANTDVHIKILQTTDVHGNFFPYNFITRTPWKGSLARVASVIDSVRAAAGKENVVLIDNGDILQGQPTVYYYNFIDTVSPHIASRIYDFLQYDAATIGNHDVETGHHVYDRWIAQTSTPILGANVVRADSGEPYLTPYTVIERQGVKIAILGLLTPAIPAWLPENLWSGLRFEDMEECAEKWIKIIKEKESPDLIVGLFHSGYDYTRQTGDYHENASLQIAKNIPGFDVVFMGHDHQRFNKVVANASGDSVVVINPANNANAVAMVDVTLQKNADGKVALKHISGKLIDTEDIAPDAAFMNEFSGDYAKVDEFVSRPIGVAEGEFSSHDAFFGPSAFIDLVHRLQLDITGADISFAAPLSFDATIKKGSVRVSDMFNLYKYENLLYTMRMTGKEIKDYLEESYSIWIQNPSDAQSHLLLFASQNPTASDNALKYPSYNFDSAAGIRYTVDVTKQKGQRVSIISMADGKPFDEDTEYKVAVNSYRGNGGGDLMTKGAGIAHEELPSRIITSTELDLRYYMLKEIERLGVIAPKTLDCWKFVPEDVVSPLISTDKAILFPDR